GRGTFSRAAAICFASMMLPHGASTRVTRAPQRSATSHIRVPNTPLTPMMTSSPGSIKLTKQNSMPALPVPLTGKVISFWVRKTCRNMVLTSSIRFTNAGSRCPTSGRDIACKTDGATSLGPGPINRRGGGSNAFGIFMAGKNAGIRLQNNEFIAGSVPKTAPESEPGETLLERDETYRRADGGRQRVKAFVWLRELGN